MPRSSVIWLDVMLRLFGTSSPRCPDLKNHQFVFMHHDPRAALASNVAYEERSFGHFDEMDAPLNQLTSGYAGLGWSPSSSFYVPVVTPMLNNVIRLVYYGENFQQEWMRKNYFDSGCCNARGVIDTVSRNVSKKNQRSRVSHIFFAHDDVPVIGKWADETNGNRVFQQSRGNPGWLKEWYDFAISLFFKFQTNEAPFKATRPAKGTNATVVRLDDVGGQGKGFHGFHLVTVHFDPEKSPDGQVEVKWIPIPR